MELSVGEKMVWSNVYTGAVSRGATITDAALEAANAVLVLRELPKIATWENVRVDERQKSIACMIALSMLHHD